MSASAKTQGRDRNDVPYTEWSLDDLLDDQITINIRRYPKRTFVGYEDGRDDLSSGADLDDCWSGPLVVVAKIPNDEYTDNKAIDAVCRALGWRESGAVE